MDGDDFSRYKPDRIPTRSGSPKTYIQKITDEAVNAKKTSNQSGQHPNLLAVDYLESADWQRAWSPNSARNLKVDREGSDIDALAVSAIGIDEALTGERVRLIKFSLFPDINRQRLLRIANEPDDENLDRYQQFRRSD